jgi:sugar transferase (PEP-CTERM system associated)
MAPSPEPDSTTCDGNHILPASNPDKLPEPQNREPAEGLGRARDLPILVPVNTKPDSLDSSSPSERRRWRVSASSVQVLGQHVDLWALILGVVDFFLLVVAVHVAGLVEYAGDLEAIALSGGAPWAESLIFGAVGFSSLLAMGLYNRRLDARTASVIARMVVGLVIGALAMVVLMFFMTSLSLAPATLGLSICVALPMLAVSRLMFVQVFGRDRFARRVLVYGAGTKAAEVQNVRVRQDLRNFQVVGYIPTEGAKPEVPAEWRLNPGNSLRDFVLEMDVDEVVVAMEDRRRGLPVQQLLECRLAGVPVTDVLSFMERESGKVELSMLYPSWLIYSEGINSRGVARLLTRVFDLLAAGLLLVLDGAADAAHGAGDLGLVRVPRQRVVCADARGPGGRAVHLVQVPQHARGRGEGRGEVGGQERSPCHRVGRVIRATRIDELPQLINVLAGKMSFVGPRPERPEFVEKLSEKIPYYRERHCVKPGITGWAQLCYPYGASEHDALEKLQYDLYYVKNKSILFDLVILLQTVEVVLWRKGSR